MAADAVTLSKPQHSDAADPSTADPNSTDPSNQTLQTLALQSGAPSLPDNSTGEHKLDCNIPDQEGNGRAGPLPAAEAVHPGIPGGLARSPGQGAEG